MSLNNNNILVTGGAGYIGSHVCRLLSKAGFTPVVFDNLSSGFTENVRFGPLVTGDLRDANTLKICFQEHKPLAVMHFAALIAVSESVTQPADYYQVNTLGAWQLLQALRNHAAATNQAVADVPFIFSSTAAVYGTPAVVPIPEDAARQPINPYGHSKLMVEQLLSDYAIAYGLRSMALRYFNAAGACLDGTLGPRKNNPSHLIPAALEAVLETRPPLQLFGSDYPTADGTAVRDYIHVDDLASAHVAALQKLLQGHEGARLNLGTGQGFSVKQVLETTARIVGRPVPQINQPRRAGDPAVLVAEGTKARAFLNWHPEHSDLETIIGSAWQWRRALG